MEVAEIVVIAFVAGVAVASIVYAFIVRGASGASSSGW